MYEPVLKTNVFKITGNTYLLRLDDTETKFFEALWWIPEGVTYNAYLYVDESATILFDTWKKGYCDLFLNTLSKIVDVKDIDYLVIHHMEPDHSGCIPHVLKRNSNVRVLAHPLAKDMIESFYGINNMKFKPVRDLEEVSLGNVKVKFMYTPWLHWPETIMSYLVNEKILFSGDVFGSFSIPEHVVVDRTTVSEEYIKFMRKYFIDVVGFYRRYVERNLKKILDLKLNIEIVAPLHGALWSDVDLIVSYYMKWARGEEFANKIVVIYASMYGFVKEAINKLIELIKARDKNVEIVVYEISDSRRAEVSDILGDVIDSRAVILGASTYESRIFPYIEYIVDQLKYKANSAKPLIIVSSYGWGGVAGKLIKDKLSSTQFNIIEVIEFKGKVNDKVVNAFKEAVDKLLHTK